MSAMIGRSSFPLRASDERGYRPYPAWGGTRSGGLVLMGLSWGDVWPFGEGNQYAPAIPDEVVELEVEVTASVKIAQGAPYDLASGLYKW